MSARHRVQGAAIYSWDGHARIRNCTIVNHELATAIQRQAGAVDVLNSIVFNHNNARLQVNAIMSA